ncbi:glycerol-3-phosphate dehydrogenase [NAD(P)+] [Elysia marginata]|uniref:Glycerol-3-phosphate dehydrogenase [NAD(+)] n=1 Tax=Elysia marginata TaxID=1093978 RepID=A0AAV4FWS9_9GAST|nr:glycerol-3-phosphate dehydrogenase [NAD(P)+] [Elysia marginata]
MNHYKIGLLGGGSWATAIAKMMVDAGVQFSWYMRNESAIEYINQYGHNPNYISSIEFHTKQFKLTSDIDTVIGDTDIIILAIPSVYLLNELGKKTVSLEKKIIFSAIKGIIPETGSIVGNYLEVHHEIHYSRIGVITGPCHAEEVALERLSYLTVACPQKKYATYISQCISSHYIKVKLTKDIIGVEYASVLKNIYSIAAGIAHGLGYGDNFQSVLMSNSIREMKQFIKTIHKNKRDVTESAYLGDLLVTGYSTFSRNRTFGNMIGKGYSVQNTIMEMNMVAEGYYAIKSAYKIAGDKATKFPIIEGMYKILYEKKNPKKILKKLTERLD